MAADSARLLASNYLEPFVSRLHDPYQVALVSYALLVAGSNVRNEAFTKLDSIKRVGANPIFRRFSVAFLFAFLEAFVTLDILCGLQVNTRTGRVR